MEGSSRKRRRSPSEASNHSDTNNGSSSSGNSATSMAATVQPSPANSDNSDRISSVSSIHSRIPSTSTSSLAIPSGSAHHSGHAMPDVQGDNQRPTKNPMAIESILRNSPPPNDFPGSSNTVDVSTANGEQSGPTASANQQIESCRCFCPGYKSENLEKNRLMYLDQIRYLQNLIIEASSSRTIPAHILIPLINKLSEAIRQNVHRLAHVMKHLQQLEEAEKMAKEGPLPIIAYGTSSTVYEIPESFGSLVLKFGPQEKILQERQNILLVSQALKTLDTLIGNRPSSSRLRSLLLLENDKFVPTGFKEDAATGLLRLCTGLDSRIPDYYDTNGDGMAVDSDDQAGIILKRIGNLTDTSRQNYSRKCEDLIGPKLDEALIANEHCFIRIYLGKSSDDEVSDDARDSASDATMEQAEEKASVNPLDDEPFSDVNLPGYLDCVIRACPHRSILGDFAKRIALGYVLLHWGAHRDARGIEFLLGSSPTGLGVRLYMLDFEDCRPIKELSAHCVREQLVPAALENYPYIPRAVSGSSDEKEYWFEGGIEHSAYTARSNKVYIWEAFARYYLEFSALILRAYGRDLELHLPEVFIDELKKYFLRKDAERSANPSPASENVASNEAEYGGSDNHGDSGNVGDDENSQSQVDHEFTEDEHAGNDGRDSVAMEANNSSEEEEDSDEEQQEEEEEEDSEDVD